MRGVSVCSFTFSLDLVDCGITVYSFTVLDLAELGVILYSLTLTKLSERGVNECSLSRL